jgi:5-formyltetrahydrofolate cyclo-ligase
MSKANQRDHIAKAIEALSADSKTAASDAVCQRLMTLASVVIADTIFAYLPLHDEVDVTPLLSTWLDESRTVGVPLVSWEQKTMRAGMLTSLDDSMLEPTQHGLQEPRHRHPIPADFIDVVLVPGVGFDASGGRLGRGGGFYDRYLETSRPPVVIGVAFDEQILDEVPCEPHDQFMTAIVTPTRTLLN